jgi:hypothetical protein
VSDRSITLHEPDGSTIDVVLVTAGTRAGLPSATFDLDFGAWDHVESHGLLHVDPARSRSSGSRPFDPGKTVQVEAVLDPVAAIDGVDGLADRLLSASAGDPLLSTEAWWSLSATQEVDLPADLRGTGTLHEGISFEHPVWLQDAAGSVGLEEAWHRAMELQDQLDAGDEPMLDVVVELFEEQDWQIDRPNPEATIVPAGVASDAGDFDLYVRTDEDKHLITAIAVLPHDVPAEHVAEVHELADQLNVQSAVGSFEVDAGRSLVSFKSGIDLTGDLLSGALVRSLVGRVLIAAERANAAFADVAAGRRGAAEAALDVAL